MSAADSFTRIVSLVAELSRREQNDDQPATIAELAARHGVPPDEITADIRTLTLLGDHADTDWLLSLRVLQQGDLVWIRSGGPFRRPVRLSPEEQLALQLALALEPGGDILAAKLAAAWKGASARQSAPDEIDAPPTVLDRIRSAVAQRSVLELSYAGEADREARTRVVHPHQVAELGVSTYIVAWADDVGAWRHFRLDRVVAVQETGETFGPRDDFRPLSEPSDTFRPEQPAEQVTVRFDASAAPWVVEAYADHVASGDGRIEVKLAASSPEWLARRVLEFGPEAEVVAPAQFRAAVRRAIA